MRLGPIFYLIYFAYSILLSIYILIYIDAAVKFSRNIFFFLIFWFCFEGVQHGFKPDEINLFLKNSSRNYVSSLFLFFSIFFYMTRLNKKRGVPFYPSLITIFVSILAYGRTGIILSFFLFFIIIFYRYFNRISTYNFLKFILVCIIIILIVFSIYSYIIENTKLSEGFSSPRFKMNSDYFKELNLKRIVIGYDYRQIDIISKYNDNPHNSFIKLHYNIGIVLVLFIIFILYTYIKNLLNFNIKKLTLILFSLLFLIRAYLDVILFIHMYDFLFFYSLILINNKSLGVCKTGKENSEKCK
jgi:hypothetical protein